MASEKWWRGNKREDYETFLRESWRGDVAKAQFPECDGCGCQVYRLQVKPGAGIKRHCVACGAVHAMCGTGAAFAAGEDLGRLACACGKNQFEVAVGYAAPAGAAPAAAVVRRCLACGTMELVLAWALAAGTTAAVLEDA